MALRTASSPSKDQQVGMHTPTRIGNTSGDGDSISGNSLQKRVTSTALRPKAVPHVFPNLDDSTLSEISPSTPLACRQLNIEENAEASYIDLPESHQPRASSEWLEDVISNAQNLAAQLKKEAKQMKDFQLKSSDDLSSFGILTSSAMMDTFENVASVSDDPLKRLADFKMRYALRDIYSGNSAKDEVDIVEEDEADTTIVASDDSTSSANFSNINVGTSENIFTSPQQEFDFDSEEFIKADTSAVKQQLEKAEESIIKAANMEPITPSQRVDQSDFLKPGEVESSPAWMNPEKRNSASCRFSIGQYFARKSSNINDIIHSINPDNVCVGLTSPTKLQPSPLPTGIRPEFQRQSDAKNDTIDLTEELGEKTIDIADNTIDDSIQELDLTLVPGRDSIMSISTIADLLDSNKGTNTLVSHFLDVANQPNDKNMKTPTKAGKAKTPPGSQNTSRDTFVISPQHNISAVKSKLPTPSKIPQPLKNKGAKVSVNSGTQKPPQSSPLKLKQRSALRSSASSSTSTLVKPVSRKPNRNHEEIPAINLASLIELPLKVVGPVNGVANLCLDLHVPITNVSSSEISCSLADTAHNRYVQVNPAGPVVIQQGASANLKVSVTALISGEHILMLEVRVSAGNNPSVSHTHAVDQVKLKIEAPRVSVTENEKNFIDFGLLAENSMKPLVISVKNLGTCSLPVIVYIQQNCEQECFNFPAPGEDDRELQVATAMSFVLPGDSQRDEHCTQDIALLFTSPSLHSLQGDDGSDKVCVEGQVLVKLNCPGVDVVIGQCMIRAEVGFSCLLVNNDNLTLEAGVPQELKLYNKGVVPLDIDLIATYPWESSSRAEVVDEAVTVKPDIIKLKPKEVNTVTITWNPVPSTEAAIVKRELHIKYDDTSNNIVYLKCCYQPPEAKISMRELQNMKLRSTRPQLAWGALNPGLTAQQFVSFKNTGDDFLHLDVNITSDIQSLDSPFKLLSDAKEVTQSLEMELRPGQERRLAVMFCPQRPGPTCALMQLSPHDHQHYKSRQLLLTGYGGNSNVVLRRVASTQERSWLNMSPGLGDHVDGAFTVLNLGTAPACIQISSNLPESSGCCMKIRPNVFILAAKGNESVNVRLSGVSNILSTAHSGEVKTLASLKINWVNEVTRRRLRRLLSKLNTSERANYLRVENAAAMLRMVESHLDNEDAAVLPSNFVVLKDFSLASAVSLSKDIVSLDLELRAEGTGTNHTRANEADTASPFVSLMDTVIYNTSQLSFGDDIAGNILEARADRMEWSVSPRDVTLGPIVRYKSIIQVCNLSANTRLCLEVVAREELAVTPTVAEVRPGETIILELRLKQEPLHPAAWPAAVKIYSKNDVAEISVRALPVNRLAKKMAVAAATAANNSFCSTTSNPLPFLPWAMPSKFGVQNLGMISANKGLLSPERSDSKVSNHASEPTESWSQVLQHKHIDKLTQLKRTLSPKPSLHREPVSQETLKHLKDTINLESLPRQLLWPSVLSSTSTASSSSRASTCSSTSSSSSTASRTGVYLCVSNINFPWTQCSTCSSGSLTIYNETDIDKKVLVSSVTPPFSVDPPQIVIPPHWQKSVIVKFCPQNVGAFHGILALAAEGQASTLIATLQGHAVLE